MKHLPWLFAITLLLGSQQLDAGEAGPRFSVAEHTYNYVDRGYGFGLSLPVDFRVSAEQGDLLFFKSTGRPGTVIIQPRPGLSLSSVQQVLRSGFDSHVVTLTPTGAPMTLELANGQGLAMEVTGQVQGREVQGLLAGIFGPDDRGYMMLVGAVQERWLKFKPTATGIIESLQMTPIVKGFEYERWENRLLGKRLMVLKTKGPIYLTGLSLAEYHLCSDMTFLGRQEFSDSQDWGVSRSSYHTGNKMSGNWQVRMDGGQPRLILLRKQGARDLISLGSADGYITLDGVPFQQLPNQLCN